MSDGRGDSLNEMFATVARRLRHASMQALAPWQIAPSQLRAISLVATHRAIRPSELAEQLRITPRSVTEVIDGLEGRGLVRRAADPDDRRATLITLTPGGADVVAAVRAARAAEAEVIFGALSAADRAQLRRILTLLTAEEDVSGAQPPPVR
ncbi:MAG: MarR family transcriptional regulator [Nocardioidaceae bacterium]